MRPTQTLRSFKNNQVCDRLADLQKRLLLSDTARQIIHNEIESAAKFWFIQGGGVEADFEKMFNGK